MRLAVLVVTLGLMGAALPGGSVAGDELHQELNRLLAIYVTDDGVRYRAWAESATDLDRLTGYIDRLEAAAPSDMPGEAALAYWINLYNAVTLELVLSHYPVDSIKDTAGFMRSPWNKKLVTVEGEELSLNHIEHDIIRKRFEDARIHFALNCASVGCPPLAREAYAESTVNDQLDAACRLALNDPRWVSPGEGRWVVTKLFDWYRKDFEAHAGSVPDFIAGYRDDGKDPRGVKIKYADYDWSLNQAP